VDVLLADSLGFCFGVRDALELVRARALRGSVYVLGPIVHNARVVSSLERQATTVRSLDQVPPGAELVLTPHGVADSVREAARAKAGDRLADATCPLVRRVHDAARALLAEGRHVVVIGRRDHVEVRGLVESLPASDATVIQEERELDALAGFPRLGVVSQTTQPLARVEGLVAVIRARFPASDVAFVDTVCLPTKTRQEAVKRLAGQVEGVVVVGGKTSNNTRELAQTALAMGCRAWWVETASELEASWFRGLRRIGVAAGTSTPDESIAEVVLALERMA
jgi:4-hydroxy-3-methylbut-2-enyl diphosphate reductase